MSITRWTRRRLPSTLLPAVLLALVLQLNDAGPWWWAVWAVITAWTVRELAVGERDERRRIARKARPA